MAVLGSSATSPIKSIQTGTSTQTINNTSDITITAVDTDKAFVTSTMKNGYGGYNNTVANSFVAGVQFENSTTIRFSSGNVYYGLSALASCVSYWTVVEYV